MCLSCDQRRTDRRRLLSLLGSGAAGALAPSLAFASGGPTTKLKPDEALVRLNDGNARFVSAPQVCAADLAKARASNATGQQPWATIVSCSDSRVPPELLFGGLGVGELFVARNAGNMVDTATMGTIEYGAAVLGVPLVVVLGHERCGAVSAACDIVRRGATYPGSILPMVQKIVPAAQAALERPGDFVDNTVRESARRTARMIASKSKIVADRVKAGKVKVVAARYDLDDGKVEILS